MQTPSWDHLTSSVRPVELRQGGYAPFGIVSEPARLGLRVEEIQTRFGSLSYLHSEPSSQQVTMYLHGAGGSWRTWSPYLQMAKARDIELGDVLLVDLPGFGDSQNHADSLGLVELGDALRDLALSHDWSDIRLVGHSMGGFLALDMASRGLPEISRVDVISGAYFSVIDTVNAPAQSFAIRPRVAAAYLSLVLFAHTGGLALRLAKAANRLHLFPLLLHNVFAHPRDLPASVTEDLAQSVAPKSFLLAARNGRGYEPEQCWSSIEVPVRAVFGAHDALVPPADTLRLQRALPECSTICLEDVSHFAHIERPDLVLSFFDARPRSTPKNFSGPGGNAWMQRWDERGRRAVENPWIAVVPLTVTVLLAVAQGTFYTSGCGPLHTMVVLIGGHVTHQCSTISFTGDLPSLGLGISATVATVIFRLSARHWREVPSELRESGVLDQRSANLMAAELAGKSASIALDASRFRWNSRLHRGLRFLSDAPLGHAMLALVALLSGLFFHAVVDDGAHLFRDYAAGQANPQLGFKVLKAHWWAGWHHFWLALIWVLVGSSGVYFAARDLLAFLRRAAVINRLSDASRWRYAPARSKENHPWAALMRLANLRVIGFGVFLLTLLVLVYLARASQTGGARNVAIVGLALGGGAFSVIPLVVLR